MEICVLFVFFRWYLKFCTATPAIPHCLLPSQFVTGYNCSPAHGPHQSCVLWHCLDLSDTQLLISDDLWWRVTHLTQLCNNFDNPVTMFGQDLQRGDTVLQRLQCTVWWRHSLSSQYFHTGRLSLSIHGVHLMLTAAPLPRVPPHALHSSPLHLEHITILCYGYYFFYSFWSDLAYLQPIFYDSWGVGVVQLIRNDLTEIGPEPEPELRLMIEIGHSVSISCHFANLLLMDSQFCVV